MHIDDHEDFLKRVDALRPDVTIERLPLFVVRAFASKCRAEGRDGEGGGESAAETVGSSLWSSLMPFQKTGVKFALASVARFRICAGI